MAIRSFGSFLRYHVNEESIITSASECSLSSQQSHTFPNLKNPPWNHKDNDLVKFLEEKELYHPSSGTESCLLWYIVMCIQRPIPPSFSSFNGYNVPECSKHWKRRLQNQSSDTLKSPFSFPFFYLQESYCKRKHWQGFHVEVQSLAGSITHAVYE